MRISGIFGSGHGHDDHDNWYERYHHNFWSHKKHDHHDKGHRKHDKHDHDKDHDDC
jgi:hypothetical protein